MVVYIDSKFRCHLTPTQDTVAQEVPFFDDKDPAYIEGYCYYQSEDGGVVKFYPWKDAALLDSIQRNYEAKQAAEEEYSAALTEIEAALGITQAE